MNIKELINIVNKTPCNYVSKVLLNMEKGNKLLNFNDYDSFDYECMELNVLEWEKHNDVLIIKVSKLQYLKILEEFYKDD